MAIIALRVTGVVSLVSILVSCASAGGATNFGTVNLVWPESPSPARIVYRGYIHRKEDLGITRSLLERVKGLLFGESTLTVVKPMDVLVTGQSVYVADPGVGGVHHFDEAGAGHEVVRMENDQALPSPVALALGDDRIYVSDPTLGVLHFSEKSQVARLYPLSEKPKQATGLAYNRRTKVLFVSDTAEHHIKVYDESGKLMRVLGRRGDVDGQFNFPTYLWLDQQENLYVSDSLNFRVQVFSSNGEFKYKFGQAGNATGYQARPKGIAVDRLGHIYVVDSLFHVVQVFDAGGRFLLNFGTQGSDFGEFWLPTGIFIDTISNAIYIADSYNKRVQVFRYVGGES
ncbi:MAG: 6-bladed beta-propeller [Gammaproteobacteria bacterium]|nr:6-bladed beta-propeller [Gammaproteobacteria bacterium]